MRIFTLLAVLLVVLAPIGAHACIWDRDTLAMERQKFPTANELIAGYFARHSTAYYQWRADQIKNKPTDEWSASDYDDLAAAQDKLGDPAAAVQTILAKINRFPDEGVYESQANLGTFYIHAGELEKGLTHIDKAIEINPDAHFGREVYQKLLVEYLLQCHWYFDPQPLEESPYKYGPFEFDEYVLKNIEDYGARQEEINKAIHGVLGMMRFGNHRSPILLSALGDLLRYESDKNGTQRLAARAYLKASYETDNPVFAEAMRSAAEASIHNQEGETLANIESKLKNEIASGDAFFAEIVADEQAWIDANKDLDVEFAQVYYRSPSFDASVSPMDKLDAMDLGDRIMVYLIGGVIVVAMVVLVGILVIWRFMMRPPTRAGQPGV